MSGASRLTGIAASIESLREDLRGLEEAGLPAEPDVVRDPHGARRFSRAALLRRTIENLEAFQPKDPPEPRP